MTWRYALGPKKWLERDRVDSESSESEDEGGLEGFKGGLWLKSRSRSTQARDSVTASISLRLCTRRALDGCGWDCGRGFELG
jgi:hypothetical protein